MSETIKNTGATIWEWRIAIAWFALFTVNSLCSAIMISLLNTTWSEIDNQARFLIVVGVIWNWTNTVMAFVSKQANRIKKTGEVFPVGDTSFTTKTQ